MLKKLNMDVLGMGTSIICALHCMAIPFLITFAASTGLEFLQHSLFESVIFGMAALFILASLLPSFLKQHKNAWPLFLGIAGLGFVFINHEWLQHQAYWLSFLGAIMITTAHYKNLMLRRKMSIIRNG